jgi:hypothetical protein
MQMPNIGDHKDSAGIRVRCAVRLIVFLLLDLEGEPRDAPRFCLPYAVVGSIGHCGLDGSGLSWSGSQPHRGKCHALAVSLLTTSVRGRITLYDCSEFLYPSLFFVRLST